MGDHASDYTPGHMDIREQSSTYALFGALTKWGSLLTAVIILFLTLLFCTKAGFLGALAAAVVVAVIGVLLLRDKSGGH
jgi:hypothetical protein